MAVAKGKVLDEERSLVKIYQAQLSEPEDADEKYQKLRIIYVAKQLLGADTSIPSKRSVDCQPDHHTFT